MLTLSTAVREYFYSQSKENEIQSRSKFTRRIYKCKYSQVRHKYQIVLLIQNNRPINKLTFILNDDYKYWLKIQKLVSLMAFQPIYDTCICTFFGSFLHETEIQ